MMRFEFKIPEEHRGERIDLVDVGVILRKLPILGKEISYTSGERVQLAVRVME